MNKVTKDLMKWFPVLSEGNALNVYSQLMIEGIDFSTISNKELKAESKRVIIEMYGDE
jgi:metal-dependent HD superfamily phosphatase/phosphodiesterase